MQLRVARRADELSRGNQPGRERDWRLWTEAEREIFVPVPM